VLLLFAIAANGQTYEVAPAPFNSPEADFGGTFNGNHIIYSSSRQRTEITYNDDTTHQFFTDLYITSINKEGEWEEPRPIKGQVNTLMNEAQCTFSQDGKTMYYTGNLKNALNQRKEKSATYALGIVCAKLYNREWIIEHDFPYNSSSSTYSCGHPFLAQSDSLFLFSSNQPGGYGGSDLYYCLWQNNAWSNPENLGPTINTEGNEFYPFVNAQGVLYFSSDSRDDSEGLDIYCALPTANGGYEEPVRLPEPINTEADDFAYSEKQGSNRGCISSNRDGVQDDIYLFTRYEDNFNHCLTNAPPHFCYMFSDENYAQMPNLPFTYVWRFSDGDVQSGSQVKKCFDDFGHYTYSLEVQDTLTRQFIMTANEDELEISRPEEPYLMVPPTWALRQDVQGIVTIPTQLAIDTASIEWLLNDTRLANGKQFQWKPDTLGEFLLTVRMKTKGTRRVASKAICIEQRIVIQPDPVQEEYPPIVPISISTPQIVRNVQGEQLIPRYYIVMSRSKDSLSANDSRWLNAPRQVLEMSNHTEFIYVLEETNDLSQLLQQFQHYREAGHSVEIVQCLNTKNIYLPVRTMNWTGTNSALKSENTSPNTLSANDSLKTNPTLPSQTTTYIDLDKDYMRKVKYVAAVMNIERQMDLQIVCEYPAKEKAQAAQEKALKMKELLIQFNVEPDAIAIATQLNENVVPQHEVKMILQYPYTAAEHE
jgi:hypothetical protein